MPDSIARIFEPLGELLLPASGRLRSEGGYVPTPSPTVGVVMR